MQFSKMIEVGMILGALGASGCISDSEDNDGLPPPSGITAQDIVIEAMENRHFASGMIIDGEPRELVTYEGDSGQICMAILGLPYPEQVDGDDGLRDADGNPEDEWYVYSAQATRTLNDAGEPLFYGKIYWDDGSDDWVRLGEYTYLFEEEPSQIYLDLDEATSKARLDGTDTHIDSFVSLLEPCSKLSNPSGSSSPTPPPLPAPTPI